jgi:hypothetical protein
MLMAGTMFNYEAGRIDARFTHYGKGDYIQLDIRMDGDTIITTECDDNWQKAEPEFYQKDSIEFRVYMSADSWPFKDFIRFLEAITIGVQECVFRWDAEGPNGEMRWERRFVDDTGFLTVQWWGRKEEFNHRMMLNTRQMVEMLYTAFRSFVDSSDYDPIRYETLSYGEGFELVIKDATLDDLCEALILLNAESAEAVLQRLFDAVSDRSFRGLLNQRFPLAHFLNTDDEVTKSNQEDPIIEPSWNTWDMEQRRANIKDIYTRLLFTAFGENLRQLRSGIIESWLAQPVIPES